MIFPERVFGKLGKANIVRLRDRADSLATWLRSSSRRLVSRVDAAFQRDERDQRLALQFIRPADHGGFGDLLID